jgi:hypothetical protein
MSKIIVCGPERNFVMAQDYNRKRRYGLGDATGRNRQRPAAAQVIAIRADHENAWQSKPVTPMVHRKRWVHGMPVRRVT